MLDYTKEELLELGAEITTREIYQQPTVWKETYRLYQEKAKEIQEFLEAIGKRHGYIKVILTGAGTSAYVGDTLVPYLQEVHDERHWNFQSIATTDIVAHPQIYLKKEVATVLVSFARSGNSPESVATVQLAQDLVDELYQITITCAAEGKLAQQAHGDERNLLLLQPKETNDAGFAMTSSFTSMLLTALLVFDPSEEEIKAKRVEELIHLSEQVLEKDREVKEVVDLDFERVIYLGAGPFFGRQVVLLTDQAAGIEHVREVLVASSAESLDIYRAFPYIIYGQLISLLTSLKVQNRPDTPSPTGTVNRVVQGVVIHPFR